MGGSRTNTVVKQGLRRSAFFARGVRRAVVTTRETLALHPEITLSRDSLALTHTPRVAQASHPVSRPRP